MCPYQKVRITKAFTTSKASYVVRRPFHAYHTYNMGPGFKATLIDLCAPSIGLFYVISTIFKHFSIRSSLLT